MIHLKDQIIQTVDLALADMELVQQSGPVCGEESQLLPLFSLMP